MAENRQRL